MKKLLNMVLLCSACMLMSSCLVSKKKYDIAESGRWAALMKCDSLSKELNSEKNRCLDLVNDTTKMGTSLRNYISLLNASKRENTRLSGLLNASNSELQASLNTILELQGIIDAQNEKVKSLLDNVKNALMGFSDDQLSVREEGGKIYVAMSDKLMFKSGSAEVNELGKNALGKLAEVLNRQTDIDVVCEGHTDNVPIKTAIFKDNWDLSVVRATSIVRILIDTYGVNPLQIQPAGRGEYKPVADNATPDGRAQNRRTEIIIAPKLDSLFEMLKQ